MAFTQVSTDGIKNGTIATADLADNAVTLAKLADINVNQIIGRLSSGSGDPEALNPSQIRSIINVENGATADQTASEILSLISDQHISQTNVIDIDANNKALRIGESQNLQLTYTGNEARISQLDASNPLRIMVRDGAETAALFNANGAVELYYDNSKKFETTSDGVKISGAEGVEAILTFEPDEGDNASDKFRFRASDSAGFFLENGSSNETSIKANFNGSVELYYDNSKQFETTSDGATVTGSLGIGTTSPGANLEVNKGSVGTYLKVGGDNASNGRALTFTSSTGNTGSNGALHTINATSSNGAIALATGSSERMRIDSAGKVFIGTTSGSERLKVETTANTMVPMTINDSSNTSTLTHRILFSTGGTEVGRIRCTNSATQYNTSGSDRSMKKNFELWDEDVLSLFKNINPQKFNFIQEEDGATKSKGFIAQELANSFPEAYSKGEKEDDKYWFNPSGMVVYLMKAIQELEAEVAALKAS